MIELARFVIFRGRDPFTPPQTKLDWVPTSLPGIKTPVMRYKWMNSEVDLIVYGPGGDQIIAAAQSCLQQAAVKSLIAGMIAGYASGGSAAITATVATFTSTVDSCMEAQVGQQLDITAEIQNPSHWDEDWS